jgi:hypothetical protein
MDNANNTVTSDLQLKVYQHKTKNSPVPLRVGRI